MSGNAMRQATDASRQRIIVYVDGFNLYYGLKSKKWRRYYWLDVRRLSENLLLTDQTLAKVRYFTSRIPASTRDSGRRKRQATFIEALETRPGLSIHYGQFLRKSVRCPSCGSSWKTAEEKMTDVNIAVELLGDVQDDAFDTAIVISGDSDLTGPVQAVCQRYVGKRVVIAFPPDRHSKKLKSVATAWFAIGRKLLHESQLPETVTKADGVVLHRPQMWR